MDRFLRELDAAIAALAGPDRERVVLSLRQFIEAVPGLVFIKAISKMAFLQLLSSITIGLASDRTPEEWLAKVRDRARVIGPNVEALFSAL